MTCIGEPISWLRLERYALDPRDEQVTAHLAACPACRACLHELRSDIVALPVLDVRHVRHSRRWWLAMIPAFAAAAIVLFVLRPRPSTTTGGNFVKGVGEVVLDLIRDRGGTISAEARDFAPGDRWKVVVTCPPEAHAWIDVAVVEAGAETADFPLPPVELTCGNRIVLPGAFELTGTRPNRVCIRIGAGARPPRGVPHPGDEATACLTIRPEP